MKDSEMKKFEDWKINERALIENEKLLLS